MQVLSWEHKRHLVVRSLAAIEPTIGQRESAMKEKWAQLREKGSFIPEEDSQSTPQAAPAARPEPVPDYLR